MVKTKTINLSLKNGRVEDRRFSITVDGKEKIRFTIIDMGGCLTVHSCDSIFFRDELVESCKKIAPSNNILYWDITFKKGV